MLNIYDYHAKPKQLDHYRELAPVMKDVQADRLPEDPRRWLTAVLINGGLLELIPESQRTRDLCLAAVSQNGWALELVPSKFRDRDLCLTAVSQDGWALQFVPEELRDRELCLTAVSQDRLALKHVPEEIRQRYPEIEQAARR